MEIISKPVGLCSLIGSTSSYYKGTNEENIGVFTAPYLFQSQKSESTKFAFFLFLVNGGYFTLSKMFRGLSLKTTLGNLGQVTGDNKDDRTLSSSVNSANYYANEPIVSNPLQHTLSVCNVDGTPYVHTPLLYNRDIVKLPTGLGLRVNLDGKSKFEQVLKSCPSISDLLSSNSDVAFQGATFRGLYSSTIGTIAAKKKDLTAKFPVATWNSLSYGFNEKESVNNLFSNLVYLLNEDSKYSEIYLDGNLLTLPKLSLLFEQFLPKTEIVTKEFATV